MIATTVRSASRVVSQYGRRSAQLSSTSISDKSAASSSCCSISAIRCSSSSAALNNDAASPPPPPSAETTSTPHNVYMWGTSKQGTIPLSLLQEGGASASSGGMFSTGNEKIVDHPMSLNLDQGALTSFLGDDNDNNTTDDDDATKLQQIFCGATGTAMVLNDGRCFVFGSNKNGELGIGQDGPKSTETPVHVPLPDPVAKVSLGPNFSAFLTTTGDLYTCGYGGSAVNGMGCLGHGNMESYQSPKLVNSLVEDGCYASDVHCGEYSMTVLTTEGEVLTCGTGSFGRLGNMETLDQLYLEPVEMIAGDDVVQIASGFAFSLALNKGGIIHAWGKNNEGQLGAGVGLAVDVYAMESLPTPIEGLLEGRKVTRIAAGHSHAAAVTSTGELFTWGMHMDHEPKLENSLLHTKIVDVACGQNYTLALDQEGRLYSLGKGKTGVLGLASTKMTTQPKLVEGIPAGEKVVTMSAGWTHVACTTALSE